jgi:hypothetical protein
VSFTFDDVVLSVQRGIDRLARRLRRGEAPPVTQRRLQIDGLSRGVLEGALASGYMPFLQRLLRRNAVSLRPMSVGLPTSTPAFQMAAMYGIRPNIPGFHYYDRERGGDIHFPRAGHAAWVEGRHTAGRRGILEGGSAYGCIFTGGADNNLFTFASLTRPSGRGLLAALSPFVVLTWVIVKSLLRTIIALARMLPRLATRPVDRRQGWRWLTVKIGLGIWLRAFFTLGASRDVYAGVPAVYVNYIDYDEAAHMFGPRSRRAVAGLRHVDRAIQQLWRVVRRVPEHRYDVYVLADHGQTACSSYRDVTGGHRLELWIFEEFLRRRLDAESNRGLTDTGLVQGMRARSREARGVFQHFLNYLNEDYVRRPDPEAHEQDGIRVISAGPNAFLYLLDAPEPLDVDALEQRLPGLAETLSKSPGIGIVLARSAEGPVCFWRGERHLLRGSDGGPFAGRTDAALVVQGIEDLMRMPSAGDLVIYGIGAPHGHVSYLPEVGAHAGPSAEEMHTFIIHPPGVTLPSVIEHPVQLYGHFIRYRSSQFA